MPLGFSPGDTFPDVTLHDQTGAEVSIAQAGGGAPLILSFYRGPW